ncbi:MAG: hypothetical protein RLZZ210_318, partial [Pseudomonadota bacterium]
SKAKVLELGCASGGNLIPHAYRNPKSEYVGIDLSGVQIKAGQEKIQTLGLKNIKLEQISISDIKESFGKFDYIIVHGVYSWIPENVQQDILRICSENLSPKGLAFISYNTYPGWKVKEVMRDAMMLRGSQHSDPHKKLAHARGMVNFIHEMAAPNSIMRQLVDSEIDLIRNSAPHYLAHEFLEEYNSPCYFKDFVAKAEQNDLTYVGEAEPHTMFVGNLGQQVAAPLLNECGNSQVMLEQYMDFLKNRPFRQTILTHKKRASKIKYKIVSEDIKEFEFCGRFNSAEKVELDYIPTSFTNTKGIRLSVSQPIEKAAILTLSENAPSSLNFRQILEGAQKRLGSKLPIHADTLAALLEQLIIQGLIRFTIKGTHPTTQISKKPIADDLVRYDATKQPQVGTANLWHESVRLELIQQHILPKLDGKHTTEQLVDHLVKLATSNVIQFSRNGSVITSAEDIKISAQEHLTNALEVCRQQGLLIG